MSFIKNRGIKWWLSAISCMAFFLVIAIFAYNKVQFIVRGVEIKADIKKDNNSALVEVAGNAKNSTYISLNGREIFIDKEGNFSEKVGLLPGLSIISIEARDKLGKEDIKKFEIVYGESAESIALRDKIMK